MASTRQPPQVTRQLRRANKEAHRRAKCVQEEQTLLNAAKLAVASKSGGGAAEVAVILHRLLVQHDRHRNKPRRRRNETAETSKMADVEYTIWSNNVNYEAQERLELKIAFLCHDDSGPELQTIIGQQAKRPHVLVELDSAAQTDVSTVDLAAARSRALVSVLQCIDVYRCRAMCGLYCWWYPPRAPAPEPPPIVRCSA